MSKGDEKMPEAVRCDQCGQLDDHPMIHFAGARSVHFDCMSADEQTLAYGTADGKTIRKTADLARAGIHGDELRARIEKGV